MEVDLLPVHADIGDRAPGRDDLLAQLERSGYTHGFDGGVDAAPMGHLNDGVCRVALGAVDGRRGAKAPGDVQTVVVEVDHDDLGRGIELRGEKGSESDRARTDDRDRAPRFDFAVENAALEA